MKDAAKISDGDILNVLLYEEKEYDINHKVNDQIRSLPANQSMDSTTPNLRRGKKVCSTRGSFFFKLYIFVISHIDYSQQEQQNTNPS